MSTNLSGNPPSLAFAPSLAGRPQSSIPTLGSVVRPITPVSLENITSAKAEKKTKNIARPRSAIPSPSKNAARSNSFLSTKRIVPCPPNVPKPGKSFPRRRQTVVPATYIQPRKSPELGGPYALAVVGKTVGKADKNTSQFEEKSNQDLVEEKEQLAYKSKIPRSFDRFKKNGSKLPPSRSFDELSKGSKIPVLSRKNSKSRAATPCYSRCNSLEVQTESLDAINGGPLFTEESDKGSYKPVTVIIKKKCVSETALLSEEKTEGQSSPELSKQVRLSRSRSARHVLDMGKVDINAHYYRDLAIQMEKPKALLRSRFDKPDISSKAREILPSKLTSERLQAVFQERMTRDFHHRKCGELIDEIALNNAVKEFKNIHDMLLKMKRKYSPKKDHGSDIFISSFSENTSGSNILVLKNLANELCKMVTEVDNSVSLVQKSAQNLVGEFQDRLSKTTDKLSNDLLLQQQEVQKLRQANIELEYSIKEKDCNFESLQALVDNLNAENDKLEKRCRELEESNERATLELTFRCRELNNLRCDVQRRDVCSSQMLDEYHNMWREKNQLNTQICLMQTDLSVAENRRLILCTESNELREQIDNLMRQVRELGGSVPEFEEATNQDDSNSLNEKPDLATEFALKPAKSFRCLHTADADPTSSVDPKHISSDEYIVFLNEGELQNGLHDKGEAELLTNKEARPAKELANGQNHQMVNGREGVVMQMADGLEIIIPQDVAERLMNLELAIQERNIQLTEFQEMIDSLKEQNSNLEQEKEEEIEKYSSFRQETLEEAQHLRDIHSRLQEKEKELDELLRKNSKEDSNKEDAANTNGDDGGTDWFEECVKVSKRVKELQDLLDRQDGVFKEMEAQREAFKEEIKKLKESTTKKEDDESVALQGVPELLKDIQNVVDKLRKKDTRTKNTPKPIRFYSDTDLAAKELQSMKKAKTNAVFIVADAFSTSDKEFAYKRFNKKKKLRKKMKIKSLLESNTTLRDTVGIQEEVAPSDNAPCQPSSHLEANEGLSPEESSKETIRLEKCSTDEKTTQEDSAETEVLQSSATTESTLEEGAGEEQLVYGELIADAETGRHLSPEPTVSLQGDDAEETELAQGQEGTAIDQTTTTCDILDLSQIAQEECTFTGFAYSPIIAKSLKEMKRLDVDKLRGALEDGRAVNTMSIKSAKHTSMLLFHRQKLSPLYEFDEPRGESREGRQTDEESAASSEEKQE